MAYIENDGSEMAADLKRDFLAGGVIAIFFMPRLEEKSRSHAEAIYSDGNKMQEQIRSILLLYIEEMQKGRSNNFYVWNCRIYR